MNLAWYGVCLADGRNSVIFACGKYTSLPPTLKCGWPCSMASWARRKIRCEFVSPDFGAQSLSQGRVWTGFAGSVGCSTCGFGINGFGATDRTKRRALTGTFRGILLYRYTNLLNPFSSRSWIFHSQPTHAHKYAHASYSQYPPKCSIRPTTCNDVLFPLS